MSTAGQALSVSFGPLAYRLVAGPFLSVAVTPRLAFRAGAEARLLLIFGSANHVPPGISFNVVAVAMLALVLASVRDEEFLLRAN